MDPNGDMEDTGGIEIDENEGIDGKAAATFDIDVGVDGIIEAAKLVALDAKFENDTDGPLEFFPEFARPCGLFSAELVLALNELVFISN